ncbi:MAG: putative ABC transporter permease [Coriobacteriales bacterium]|jgi:uncharacterized membrane protein|nr:putative ABC transporter permease [Coriobacteriales bacterium]
MAHSSACNTEKIHDNYPKNGCNVFQSHVLGNHTAKNRALRNCVSLFAAIRLYFLYFMLASVIGFVYEFLLDNLYYQHPYVLQGPLHGPWLTVYGFGGVAIIALVKKFSLAQKSLHFARINLMPIIIFVVMFFLFGTIEFIAHYILDVFFDFRPWDYSEKPLNILGRTCVEDVLRFAILGIICLYSVIPAMDRLLQKLGAKASFCLFFVTAGIFFTDCIYSIFFFPLTV